MNIEIAPACEPETGKYIRALFSSSNGNFEQLLEGWVTASRTAEIVSGWDDNNPCVRRVYFIFLENNKIVAEFYLSTQFVRETFSDIDSFIPPSIGDEISMEDIEAYDDEEFFDRRDAKLEGQWNEGVGERVFPLSDAIKIALGYALGENGQVRISPPSKYLLEDLDVEFDAAKRLLRVAATQSNSTQRLSRKEDFYSLKTDSRC